MQMKRAQIFAGQLMLLFPASYVLPLQAYLTRQPVAGSNNFVQYAPMYLSPLDIDAANAPVIAACSALLIGDFLAGEGEAPER